MYAVLFRHIFVVCFSFLLTYYLVPIVARMARVIGLLDIPDDNLKRHKEPTPYLGGLAIYIGFIATLGIAYPFENHLLWLLLGSTLVLCIGLIDDAVVLKPSQKFLGQCLAVACFLKGGFSLKSVFFHSAINTFLSGFWMLSVINAFNLVDVMDGLASTIALCGAIGLCIIALLFGQLSTSLLLLAFIGPVFAFWLYNRPPARIYLGDAGSMFLGGFLSAVPLLIDWSAHSWDAYYAPVIILGVPLMEVFFLVVLRTWHGIPFFRGSPHHFSIFLRNKGWSKNAVLGFAAIASMLLFLIALAHLYGIVSFLGLLALLALFFVAWIWVVLV